MIEFFVLSFKTLEKFQKDAFALNLCESTFDLNVRRGERWKVRWLEGFEGCRRRFARPIATQQVRTKEHAHLGYIVIRRNHERRDEVVQAVAPRVEDRHLRTGQNDNLAQSLEHKGQGGGSITESIGAVKDHESIETLVGFLQRKKLWIILQQFN